MMKSIRGRLCLLSAAMIRLCVNWVLQSKRSWLCAGACLMAILCRGAANDSFDTDLHLPRPGDNTLRILSPNLLELVRINTKQPDPAHVDSWDWITAEGN